MKKILSSVIVLTLFISGCATLRDYTDVREPDVTFKNMSVQNITFDGVTLLFDFEVNNPNRFGVKAEKYNYEFFINDRSFITGLQEEPLQIDRESVSLIQVPVSMSFSEVYQTFSSVLRQDSLSYKLSTEVEFDLPIAGSRTVPVSTDGMLPIPRVPRVQFGDFNVKDISLTGADVDVSFRVSNPNAFGISISNAKYLLRVNGRQWLDTTLEENIEVDGSENKTITIPLRLSATQMGSAMFEIMSGNTTFNYELQGSAEISADLMGFQDGQIFPFNLDGVYQLR
jgi:LEA14-like dessication related protein